MRRRDFIAGIAGSAAAWPLVATALASTDTFPSRPLRLIVGFPPGAAGDTIARVVGASMSQSLKQQIVVENRPGAGTTIAAELVARSPADGYSLFLCQVATLTAAVTSPNIRFDLAKDFA